MARSRSKKYQQRAGMGMERGVDGGKFAIPFPLAGPPVDKVVVPALDVLLLISQVPKRGAHALANTVWIVPTPGKSYGERGESEARGRRAGHIEALGFGTQPVGANAVENQTGVGVGLVPEVAVGSAGKVFEKGI